MPTILYRKVHCSSDSDTIGYLLKLEFYFSVGKFYNGVVFQCIGTFLNAQSVNNARLVSATEKFSLGLKIFYKSFTKNAHRYLHLHNYFNRITVECA